MKKSNISSRAAILGLALAAPSIVEASHFRGGAMVPSITADGTLKVDITTFWRPTFVSSASPSVLGSTSGGISISQTSSSTDTSDSRFTVRSQTFTSSTPVTGAQNFTITWDGFARIAGIRNASEDSWSLTSQIGWDGSSTTKPIDFNFASIQPEVVRGANYNGSLGATSPNGDTLSYNQALAMNISSQPPGFTIDPATGAMHIPAASTAGYLDNSSGQPGGDYAFSGNIFAVDGSGQTGRVQFDWMFDAVDTGATNSAPTVADAIINAIVGDTVTHTFTATDIDGDPLTWTFLGQLGSVPAIAPTFNPATRQYSWNTTGSVPGNYIAQARASDGSLTDTGNLTINLSTSSPQPNPVPDSGSTMFALGSALVGLFGAKRLAKKANQRRG